ncbi:MAG: hypothetical protein M1836_005354 [Candelina mexicana]|nr:MAG: hypothetical protein M1836_005354 [Candelina mexicana]
MASLRPAAAALTGTQLAGRAVHIKVHPRPRNLDESREVLRVLEKYGKVVMFKNLRHEFQTPSPNTVLAIYQHASSASNLVAASPLRYALQSNSTGNGMMEFHEQEGKGFDTRSSEEESFIGRNPESTSLGNDETSVERDMEGLGNAQGTDTGTGRPGHPSSTDTSHQPPSTNDASTRSIYTPPSPSNALNRGLQEFQLSADISHFNHRAYIERQPHYAGFKPDMKSIVAEDLATSVPLSGLSDLCLRKAEVPVRVVNRKAQELAKRKTLREIWEEGTKDS